MNRKSVSNQKLCYRSYIVYLLHFIFLSEFHSFKITFHPLAGLLLLLYFLQNLKDQSNTDLQIYNSTFLSDRVSSEFYSEIWHRSKMLTLLCMSFIILDFSQQGQTSVLKKVGHEKAPNILSSFCLKPITVQHLPDNIP